jgi:RNA polymerase sigma factor (sigma-70 family)
MAHELPVRRLAPEELLAHLEWMRHLARALVGGGDGDEARDLAQEGMAAALARPPTAERPVRPWLAGVLRNLARMRARTGGRRRRREADLLVDDDQAAPSPEALVERVETERRLAALVLALGEPLRTTVLLRYYEGRTAAEIARLQEVPAGTVRWRLKQGLDQLRAELDRAHDGDRRRWCALLMPWGSPRRSLPPTFLVAAGALLMKTKIGIVVGVLVALALVVAGGTRRSRRVPPAQATRPAPRPLRLAVHPGAGPQLSPAPVDPVGASRLQGQVIDEAEAPLAGAVVAIDTSPTRLAISDANGAFTFTGLPARAFSLEARAGELFAGPVHTQPTDEPVVLRARAAPLVEVAVVDGAARPIGGATVEVRGLIEARGQTGGDGVVRLAGVGPGWRPLRVEAAGFAPVAQMLVVEPGPRVQRVTVRLATGVPVAGRVLGPDGQPVAGARVWARSSSEPFAAVAPELDAVESDAAGRWRLPALAAGTYQLAAAHPDHAPGVSRPTVVGRVPVDGVELRLEAGGRLAGQVRDPQGRPLARVQVRAAALSRTLAGWSAAREAFTDDGGQFRLAGLPRRSVQVVATDQDAASPMATVDLAAAPSAEVTLVLSLRAGLEGMVVDGRGRPVPEAQVMAEPVRRAEAIDPFDLRGLPMGVSDGGGRFRFPGLPEGEYRLRAAAPGRPPRATRHQPATVARAGARGVKVVVLGDGVVAGEVVRKDGTRAAAFTVTAGDGEDALPFTGGVFALPLPAGQQTLTIAGPSFLTTQVEKVQVGEGARTDLGRVVVEGGRTIQGRVVGPDGAPVPQAQVVAGRHLSGGGARLMIPTESLAFQETTSDDDGRFTLAGLHEQSLVLEAEREDVGRSVTVPIPAGTARVEVELRLAATGTLEGRATRDGAPFADTVVIATPQLGRANFFVVTGADGRYAFDRLAPGPYQLMVFLGRRKDMLMRPIEVTAGRRIEADLEVRTGPATLAVRVAPEAQVVLISGAPAFPGDATFEALLDQLRPREPTTIYRREARAGVASFEGLAPGVYTACAGVVAPDAPRGAGGAPIRCATREVPSDGDLALILSPPPR